MPSINYVQFEALLRDLQMSGHIHPQGATAIRNLVAGERSLSKRLSDPELLALTSLLFGVEDVTEDHDPMFELAEAEAVARGFNTWDEWLMSEGEA